MAKLPSVVQAMTDLIAAPSAGPRSLRLDTLVRLRWLAVVGQTVAVLVVNLVLGFPLPLGSCLGLVAMSALVNITLRIRYPASHRLDATPALLLLGYDVLQLSALLFLTGGLDNPFAILLLVPVIVSATTLPPRPTILLGVLVVAAASVLALVHLPLPWRPGEVRFPSRLVYSAGVWVALVSACVFTGVYAFRVAEEARQLAKALNATELVLAREQHLYALDGPRRRRGARTRHAARHHRAGRQGNGARVSAGQSACRRRGAAPQPVAALPRHPLPADLDVRRARATSTSPRLPLSHLIEEVVEAYRAFAAE